MALANMADGKTTLCVVVASVVLGVLCLLGSVLGFYHESSKGQVLQIDDGHRQIFPFKTEDEDVPSNSMLTSTKGEKGDRVKIKYILSRYCILF